MSKCKVFWLLFGILIIATFFRLYQLRSLPPGLYPDEAMDGTNAQEAIATHNFKVFYPENNGREGLFMNIQAVLLMATGIVEPWILRLPSAIFGILTVLAIYFLGKELFSKEVGLLAAFFMATNFWHINFSRISFRAIMSPFFFTSSFAFLFYFLRNSAERNLKTKAAAIFGGLLFGLGFYSYIAYRVVPLLLAVVLIYFWIKRPLSRKNILALSAYFLIFAFFTALPIGIYFLHNPGDFLGRTSQLSVTASTHPLADFASNIVKTLGMFNVQGDFNWRHNLSGAPELFWPVGVLFILGAVFSLYEIVKKKSFSDIFLFLTFIMFMLPVVISDEGIPHALRSILLIPPAMLFAALGGMKLYDYSKKFLHQPVRGLALALFLLIVAFGGYFEYFIAWGKNPNIQGAFAANYVELGRELNSMPQSTPKYVVVDTGGVLVRGIPMPSQTVMFMTDTFTPDKQAKKNIFYVLPQNEGSIPKGALIFHIQ